MVALHDRDVNAYLLDSEEGIVLAALILLVFSFFFHFIYFHNLQV